MYSGPVRSANNRNGGPSTTSRTDVPRNHGTLLPAAAEAMSSSGIAAGSSGLRQKTNAPTAPNTIENTTKPQPATSVDPIDGSSHSMPTVISSPSRRTSYGIVIDGCGRGTDGSATTDSHSLIERSSTASTTSPSSRPGAGASIGSMRTPS